MSDSSIALKPVIEEPSKPIAAVEGVLQLGGVIEKHLSWPRMSVNQRRMKRMSRSSTSALTSAALVGWGSGMAGP